MSHLLVFITGNQDKADYLARLLGVPITHQKVDLDEIQSLDLKKIVEHKARQAYEVVQRPVIVDDVSLEFTALSGLPGPFIKFFVDTTGLVAVCKMLNGFNDRSAVARGAFGYFDGNQLEVFSSELTGSIAEAPRGTSGFGWDKIFIPEGYGGKTRAELSHNEDDASYLQIKPIEQLRDFLANQA